VIFTLESNFTTSGGYGPNQVSNILGFGALAAIFLLIIKWRSPGLRLFLLLLAAILVLQAFLTFSRGGVISLFIAVLLLGLHLFRTPQARGRFLFLAVIAYGTGVFIITPILDGFTDTLWQQRFADLSTTGRSEVALADWQAFLEYPLVGTGVGLSREYHQLLAGISVTAHTEVTRMLAEHGLLGVLSLCILVAMIGYSYVKAKAGVPRAFTSTFIAWALFVMLQSAMRFLAIPLSLTLAMVVWQVSLDDAPWKET
jgi:O-antigen ligase